MNPLFDLIAQLAIAARASPISKFDGCWHHKVDEQWSIWVNGHKETEAGGPDGNIEVQPFRAYVEFNGWPAGVLDPYGGWIAAGTLANEETFAEALKTAIGKLSGQPAAKE